MSTCMHVLDASDAEVGFTEKGLNRKKLHNMHEHAIEKKKKTLGHVHKNTQDANGVTCKQHTSTLHTLYVYSHVQHP